MEHEGKEKSPYSGVLIASAIMIAIPLLLFLLVKMFCGINESISQQEVKYTAQIIGFGLGSVINLSYAILGLLKEPFRVVAKRVTEFFRDFKITPKYAFKWYWQRVKEDGVVFWIYITIILVFLFLTIQGVIGFVNNVVA